MSKPTYYITTPIYYPSDRLHIGHSYTTVAADAEARYKRMQGFDVMFLTGTDEHGQKIARKAEAKGVTPQQYVDEIVDSIKKLWKLMNISNDSFIRTTDQKHKDCVQKIFKKLYDKGDIYKSEYEGLYCAPCESFWTESQLKDGKCPDCNREVEKAKEESYFFRLSKYQKRLEELYEKNPEFISPQTRLNEMLNNFIKPGLDDLCVSRTSFKWGVPVSFDQKHVVYVWVDALSNYITALGYLSDDDADFKKYWPADVHLVGKEIVRFHTIIWPAILMALDLPMPKRVFGHGWLLLDGGKMSKSVGNVVDPEVLCERYSVDAIRYFLLREIPFGADGSFTNEALFNRINADLVNDLGNLLSRTTAMVFKYFDGQIPTDLQAEEVDDELKSAYKKALTAYEKHMDALQFSTALSELFAFITRANKYIDETAPWVLSRDTANNKRLAAVMYNLCEALRLSAILLSPALPDTAEEIFNQLGVENQYKTWSSANEFGIKKAYAVNKGKQLFPRIDVAKELEELARLYPPKEQEKKIEYAPLADEISIDDFAKTDLRVAKVLTCEPVEKSDKLLKLTVDLGFEQRQVVSGIAKWYKPADLIGKKVMLVANLKPVKLRGVLSQGMILAGDNANGDVNVIFAPNELNEGAKIR